MDEIDKKIKKSLENTPDPPADIWYKIADQLDEKEDKKRLIFWYRLPIAAAITLITGISFWLFSISDSTIVDTPQEDLVSNSKNVTTEDFKNQNNVENNSTPDTETIKSHNNYKVDYVPSDLQKSEAHNYIKNKKSGSQQLAKNDNNIKKSSLDNSEYLFNKDFNDNNILNASSIDVEQNKISKLNHETETDKNDNILNHIFKNKTTEDSIAINAQLANLEAEKENANNIEALKDLNLKIKENKTFNKTLSFSAFAGPAVLSTQESLLSGNLNDLNIKNNSNLAMGIMVHYPIAKTISIRSGLSITNLSQQTKDTPIILASESMGTASLGTSHDFNIAYTGDVQLIKEPLLIQEGVGDKIKHADIIQKTQYFEIPLEAEINLFKTKQFDIKAIIGGSSYFLTQNTVSANLESGQQKIGTAKNLNNISFSSNIGLQLQMPLSKNLYFNLEPSVKYLINPTNNNNKITPFIIGINTGFNFKF